MSDHVSLPRKEYDTLYDLLETLQDLTNEPSKYRNFFNENNDQGDLFDVMKQEIVQYAEKNKHFASFLRDHLPKDNSTLSAPSSTAPSKSTMSSKPIVIQPLNPFSPRSSSRPSLRY